MKLIIALILAAVPSMAHAQGLVHGSQFWNLNTLRGPIDQEGRWNYYFEFQPRLDFEDSMRTRILIRPAVILNLNPQKSVWAGVLDLTGANFGIREFRPWEQYQRSDRFGDLTLVNRTRLEERFRQGETDIGFRIRHMIRVQVPCSAKSNWSIVAFDELFLGLNKNKSQPMQGFDQNRLFAGFRSEFENQYSLEFGYLNQHDGSRMNHIPFLAVAKVITHSNSH
jgi:hypothetical protein